MSGSRENDGLRIVREKGVTRIRAGSTGKVAHFLVSSCQVSADFYLDVFFAHVILFVNHTKAASLMGSIVSEIAGTRCLEPWLSAGQIPKKVQEGIQTNGIGLLCAHHNESKG